MTNLAKKTKLTVDRFNRTAKRSYCALLHRCLPHWSPESVYFFTFHKCASTLFSQYVLKNLKGLRNVDYMSLVSRGKVTSNSQVSFQRSGFVYGPFRYNHHESVHDEIFLDEVSRPEFVKDKIVLFFVRDPRDIIVSKYYSFGFSHAVSGHAELAAEQLEMQTRIQSLTVDEYALETVDFEVVQFERLYELFKVCERGTLLTYEEMVTDFPSFEAKFGTHVSVGKGVMRKIYNESRPRQTEDASSHRRSGQVQGFRSKLKDSTIEILNAKLREVLGLYGYRE